ncbi:MAG TPA: cobalamin-independent methionine synthase II family protein [Burkholderiales bacterium]|nr:cobalamin-independent methionine synthase II family protein [Burkholderiales bacterium]
MTSLERIRTDVVGSLLRPADWKQARLAFETGKMSADEFARVEEACVRRHLALQERIGLDVVTDGEVSRLNFQDSFGLAVSGYDAGAETMKTQEKRASGTSLTRWEIPDLAAPGTPVVHRRPTVSKLALVRNPPLEEYKRAAPLTKRPVKVSLIGPDRVMQRFDHAASKAVYATIDAFVDDVVKVQRSMIQALVDAGCKYVHIDEPGYTAYVDQPSMDAMKKRGEDPMQNFSRSLRANARLIGNFPGVTFGIHLCRGNQRSTWHREGSYDAIAERLFNELPHQRFLLEYDSPRAGTFAPLRFVPKDKVVVLGLVSTKVPELESVDTLTRRIEEAAKYVPLERLAISPQCGFGSDVVGNLISEDDQKRKLERVVEAARKVWR